MPATSPTPEYRTLTNSVRESAVSQSTEILSFQGQPIDRVTQIIRIARIWGAEGIKRNPLEKVLGKSVQV